MTDGLRKFLLNDYNVRISYVENTELVDQLCLNSQSSPLASVIQGRAITGAILFASQKKAGHNVCLHFKGDGPVGDVFAEATFEGGCRGYVQNPTAQLDDSLGPVRIGAGIGSGTLTVTTQAEGQSHPQVGAVEIQTGEVGDDLAYYLHQSQQIQSVVNLGTRLNDVGRVEASGGLLVEIMQDVPIEFIDELSLNVDRVKTVTDSIICGLGVEEMLSQYFGNYVWQEVPSETKLEIRCTCSDERIIRMLKLIGPEEVRNLIAENKDVQVRCQFCGKNYDVELKALQEILGELTGI